MYSLIAYRRGSNGRFRIFGNMSLVEAYAKYKDNPSQIYAIVRHSYFRYPNYVEVLARTSSR